MLACVQPRQRTFAQSDDADMEMRIQRLENQLRQLTGQNEELQYRNRQLEERLRQLGARRRGGQAPAAQPERGRRFRRRNPSTVSTPQRQPGYGQPQPGYGRPNRAMDDLRVAMTPSRRSPRPRRSCRSRRHRRAAAAAAAATPSIPRQNPNAPGAPRALGGGQLPIASRGSRWRPGGRGAGEPLDLGSTSPRDPARSAAARVPAPAPRSTTLPPSATPKDEFDLGIGYMQRKDYALAEETMKNFAQKYPSDPLVADSQYWLGRAISSASNIATPPKPSSA